MTDPIAVGRIYFGTLAEEARPGDWAVVVESLQKRAEEAEGALAGLADCINTELRENGPHSDQIPGITTDMRPYVRRLVDRVRERAPSSTYAEKQSEALHRIATWADAYPLEVFPEPDLKRAAEVLKAAGITLDSISAYAMRHVITQVGGIAKAALDSPPSQGGECAGLAPPAGCRWPKTCGAQLAEAAVREEGEARLREIAHRHAREAVAPIGSGNADKFDAHIAQNILRQEEIIFYAMKEALSLPLEGNER